MSTSASERSTTEEGFSRFQTTAGQQGHWAQGRPGGPMPLELQTQGTAPNLVPEQPSPGKSCSGREAVQGEERQTRRWPLGPGSRRRGEPWRKGQPRPGLKIPPDSSRPTWGGCQASCTAPVAELPERNRVSHRGRRAPAAGRGDETPRRVMSPTSLAPGTGFVEDNVSTQEERGQGLGMTQVHHIYWVHWTGGSAQAITQAMGSGCKHRWSFHSLPTHPTLTSRPSP